MSISQEQYKLLSRPFPKDVIKSYKGKGGKTMRYIDVDVVEDRIREVDLDFIKDVTPGARSVAVHYTILGVRRGDLFDNDSETNKYGAPQVNALARASRRAAKLFGVGKELWDDEEEDEEEEDERPARKAPAKSGGKFTRPANFSDAQKAILRDKGFTTAEIKTLTNFDVVKASMGLSERGEALSRRDKAKLLEKYGAPVQDEEEDDYEEDEE